MRLSSVAALSVTELHLTEGNGKMWDKLGKEGEAILAKGYALIRKREWRQGWLLLELSYIVTK